MLGWDMRSHAEALLCGRRVFLDRGVPDTLGYLRLCGLPIPDHAWRAARRFRYNPCVFVAPPWPEIFGADAERRQDWAEALRTHDAMCCIYRELGYALTELPRAPVAERVRFVLERGGQGPARAGLAPRLPLSSAAPETDGTSPRCATRS
jgi:predicted ATPase